MKRTLITLALTFMLGFSTSAQNDGQNARNGSRGLFERGEFPENVEYNSRGLINSNVGSGIDNEDFNMPLGSGLVILLGGGLGYWALKKKEDKQ